jgi:hypothetical protein
MELVKIKTNDEFRWGAEQQRAFEEIKEYLSKPSVLVPPQQDKPFYVYLSVGDTSIASVVIQVHDGREKVVFYLSRRMLDQRPDTLTLKSYAFVCSSPAQSFAISCYQPRRLSFANWMLSAHTIGSCVERPTQKVDVCIVRVQYPIPTCEGGQRASAGGPHCRKDQY